MLRPDVSRVVLLVGPDEELRAWVENVASPLGLDVIVGEKRRLGDHTVELALPEAARAYGKHLVLVDDMVSISQTLPDYARILLASDAKSVETVATHCLATD